MATPMAPECAANRQPHRAAAAQRRRRSAAPLPPPDAIAFRVNDACLLAGIGRSLCYRMVKEGRLELIRVGGRSLIGGDSLRRLLSAAPAEALPAD